MMQDTSHFKVSEWLNIHADMFHTRLKLTFMLSLSLSKHDGLLLCRFGKINSSVL